MKKIGFAVVLLMSAINCFAADAAKQLLDSLTPLQNIQANFQQSILDKDGRVLEQTSGKMTLLRPGKFRWDTQKPSHQLLIADGKKIWLYDESLKQVTVQPQTKKAASPVMLLSDPTTKLMEQFSVRSTGQAAKQLKFALTPKDKAGMFQRADLVFEAGRLSQMQLFDSLGQKTIITFTDVKTNNTLSSNLFEFTPPKGVDVVTGQ